WCNHQKNSSIASFLTSIINESLGSPTSHEAATTPSSASSKHSQASPRIHYGRLPDEASSARVALQVTAAGQLMNCLDARGTDLPLPEWQDKLLQGVLDGVCDAQMAMLLALCPNLEVVAFNGPQLLHLFAVKKPGFELEILLCVLRTIWSRHPDRSIQNLSRLRNILPCSLGLLSNLMSAYSFHRQLAELVDDVRFAELEGIY
ncbi:hypothetical protein Tdes44962_MAKER06398, partial [Teratosphaeria destructans]